MGALTAPRGIIQLGEDTQPKLRNVPLKDAAKIYHGALVGIDSDGYWNNASTAVAALGIADIEAWDDQNITGQSVGTTPSTWPELIDNTSGADAARHMVVRQGVFKCLNKSGDEVTAAMVGATVYVEDNQTVRATSGSTVAAGKLWGFADDGLPLVRVQV